MDVDIQRKPEVDEARMYPGLKPNQLPDLVQDYLSTFLREASRRYAEEARETGAPPRWVLMIQASERSSVGEVGEWVEHVVDEFDRASDPITLMASYGFDTPNIVYKFAMVTYTAEGRPSTVDNTLIKFLPENRSPFKFWERVGESISYSVDQSGRRLESLDRYYDLEARCVDHSHVLIKIIENCAALSLVEYVAKSQKAYSAGKKLEDLGNNASDLFIKEWKELPPENRELIRLDIKQILKEGLSAEQDAGELAERIVENFFSREGFKEFKNEKEILSRAVERIKRQLCLEQ